MIAERRAAPSRRQFVAGAAAAAASAAVPEAAFAAPPKARIAIVGAGIAGLNAALTLQDAGIASTVYEASNRIGGRMFSATSIWANNQVSEWCGELIDSDHETIIGLARRFGLPLEDFAGNPSLRDTYKILGRYYTVEQAYEDWRGGVQQAIAKDLEAAGKSTTYDKFTPEGQKLDQMSVAEWIDSRVLGGRKSAIGALLDVAYAIEYGADTTDQSALNIVYLLGANKQIEAGEGFNVFGASDERYHIRGGNQQLPARIARHLNTSVQLGMRMTSIARNGDGAYALGFDGHPPVAADLVILSLPFAVLRKIDTSGAGFDARKNTAIQELGRGQSGKLQLQFTSRYWREPGPWPGRGNGLSYTDEGYQNTWEVSRRQFGVSGILNNYTGGSSPPPRRRRHRSRPPRTPNVQAGREGLPRRPRDRLSRRDREMERPSGELAPHARSEYGRVLFLLESGPIHFVRRLREGAARQHLLRRRALLGRLPRFYGGRRGRRRAGGEGDPGPARGKKLGRALRRPVGLGFLGRWPFDRETPLRGLEKLGFPWILSSETSLFKGLHGIFAGRNFARPFAPDDGPGRGSWRSW